jgi:hypothetical protein
MNAHTRGPRVFGIPAPWSGDPGSGDGSDGRTPHPRLYAAWYRVYLAVRVMRHMWNLHDWANWGPMVLGLPQQRCHWCGARRFKPDPLTTGERIAWSMPFVVFVLGALIIGLVNGWA